MRASGLALPGFCPGGLRWCGGWRRITSEDLMTKSKSKARPRLAQSTRKTDKSSLARGPHVIHKDLDARPTQSKPAIIAMLRAPAVLRCRDHDGHGMAAASVPAFSRALGPRKQTRFESGFPNTTTKAGLPKINGIADFGPGPPDQREAGRPDAMRKNVATGRVRPRTSVESRSCHLRESPISKGLRARWHQACAKTSAPRSHFAASNLLFAIIANRIQADRSADLDHETKQLLDRTG